MGAPDFIIEILSRTNTKKDVKDKFELYEEYEVSEYWIVHPRDNTVVINILGEDKKYISSRPFTRGEVIAPKQFPEVEIDLEEVFDGIGVIE